MTKNWHYICKENVMFPEDDDERNGEYYDYDVDTFDYLVNNPDWVWRNNAFEERDWILDNLDKKLESNDGSIIFIPTYGTSRKIDKGIELGI